MLTLLDPSVGLVSVNVCAVELPDKNTSEDTDRTPPLVAESVTVLFAETGPFGVTEKVAGAPVVPLDGPDSAKDVAGDGPPGAARPA